MPTLNLNSDNLVVKLNVDDYKIVVKQPQYPVHVTGNSYYQFTGVTPTIVTDVQTGNLHTISIFAPSGATGAQGASGATGAQGASGITPTLVFTGSSVVNYTQSGTTYIINVSGQTGAQGIQGIQGIQGVKGDTGATGAQGVSGLTPTLSFSGVSGTTIIYSQTGTHYDISVAGVKGDKGDTGTSSWTGLTGNPLDNQDLNAIITGLTADIQTNYICCTGNTADIQQLNQDLTGLTSGFNTYTGTTAPNTYAPINHNHSQYALQSTVTGLTSSFSSHSGDTSIHWHMHDLTGFTSTVVFNNYTGATNVILTGHTADINYLSGVTDSHYQELTGLTAFVNTYTGTTAPASYAPIIHTHNQYSQTGHTHDYSTITNTPDLSVYALESNLTGHTSDLTIHYAQSGITISESQVTNLISDLAGKSSTGHTHSQYSLTGHTHSQYLTGVTCTDVTGCTNGLYAPIVHIHDIIEVTGLADALAGKSDTGHTHSQYLTGYTLQCSGVTACTNGLYAPIVHTHAYSGLTGLPTLFTGYTFTESGGTQIAVAGNNVTIYSPTGGTSSTTLVGSGNTTVTQSGSTWIVYSPTGGTGGGTWGSITGTLSGQTDLQAALDAKSGTGHTHSQYLTGYTVTAADVTGITATLYSPTGHTHSTYVEKIATIRSITGATVLTSSDSGKIIEANGTFTVTLYSGATVGTRIDIVNVGTGTITLAAQGTLQSDGTKLATQYTGASVYARGTSTWLAVGKLTT